MPLCTGTQTWGTSGVEAYRVVALIAWRDFVAPSRSSLALPTLNRWCGWAPGWRARVRRHFWLAVLLVGTGMAGSLPMVSQAPDR